MIEAALKQSLEDMKFARALLIDIITDDDTTPAERARAFASLRRLAKARDRMEAAFRNALGPSLASM